ncbi:MAG TPA: hypothetical protein VGV38_01235, partial [Pyrinomonadaceae bacterium]|nr:hypothetical protein [Pyrinomonadaceae bacterium]
DEIEDEELMLADLVEQLGDRRLAPFLLEHLRRSPEEPPDSADRMMIVFARLRGDGQLKALAESYMEMDGYHLMEEEDEANRPEGGEESGEGSGEEAERELTEEEERAEQARYEARYEAAEKVAAQRRVELLRRFLSLADEQPAEPRAAP